MGLALSLPIFTIPTFNPTFWYLFLHLYFFYLPSQSCTVFVGNEFKLTLIGIYYKSWSINYAYLIRMNKDTNLYALQYM